MSDDVPLEPAAQPAASPPPAGAGAGALSLADKLEHLFRLVHPPGRGEYPNEEVARVIEAKGGPTISGAYIGMLRRGERDNPTKKHLEALAGFFGVSPAYFFDDEVAGRIQEQLGLLVELRDSPVQQVALRAQGISPQSLAAVREIIEKVRQIEGLPDDDSDPPPARTRRPRG